MKISKNSQMIKDVENPEALKEYLGVLDDDVKNLTLMANNRIRYGDGNDGEIGENISGEFQQFTSDASADTEFSVTHGLGVVPIGIIVFWQDKAGSLYQGPTTGTNWTSSTIYLKSSGESVTYNVFLLK